MKENKLYFKTWKKGPGHYTPAIACNGFLFISGQLPIDWTTGKMVDGDVRAHAKQAFENLARLLESEDLCMKDIVKTTVFVSNIQDWAEVDAVYAEIFGEHRPARSVVPAGPLHYGALLEVEAIARYEKEVL